MRTIDSFTFFNEVDLLEGRLEYLYDHVDYFILVESDMTFSGIKKPFYFRDNMNRYKKYLDKIIYRPFVVDTTGLDFSYKPTHFDINSAPWKVEEMHRQEVINAAKIFDDTDLLILSDLDEIPSLSAIEFIKNVAQQPIFDVAAFTQDVFIYNFTNKVLVDWPGSIAMRNKFAIEHGGQWARLMRYHFQRVPNGGWHLGCWFDAEQIKTKIESFSHQELNVDEMKDISRLAGFIQNGIDPFGRDIPSMKVDASGIDPTVYSIFKKYQVGVNNDNS